jgi:hypothetical protein
MSRCHAVMMVMMVKMMMMFIIIIIINDAVWLKGLKG